LLLLLLPGIALFDITPQIRQRVQQLGVTEGFVNVLSRHTTTAVAINEYETRLLDDIRQVGGCSSSSTLAAQLHQQQGKLAVSIDNNEQVGC
jgi:hypothetical protein